MQKFELNSVRTEFGGKSDEAEKFIVSNRLLSYASISRNDWRKSGAAENVVLVHATEPLRVRVLGVETEAVEADGCRLKALG